MAKNKSSAPNRSREPRSDKGLAMHAQLTGARAAVMSAILSTQGKGVFDEVSLSLRLHVLLPIEKALSELR